MMMMTLSFAGGRCSDLVLVIFDSRITGCSLSIVQRVALFSCWRYDGLLGLAVGYRSFDRRRFGQLSAALWGPLVASGWVSSPLVVRGNWRRIPESQRNSVPCRRTWPFRAGRVDFAGFIDTAVVFWHTLTTYSRTVSLLCRYMRSVCWQRK